MEFKKKVFYITAATMLSILIISYSIMYLYFYRVMVKETSLKQQANAELNSAMADNFLQSIYHTAVQIVSDKSMGRYLSYDCSDPLETIQKQQAIKTQFTHYATHQVIDSTYYYRSTLFLSDTLPIAGTFEARTLDEKLYAASNVVYSNEQVKDEFWYQSAIDNIEYIFLNESTNEFCIARKIVNSYYIGPHSRMGTAVLVVCVDLDQLKEVFSSNLVTAGSGYAVLNEDGDILYSSNSDIPLETYDGAWEASDYGQEKSFKVTLSGKTYFAINQQSQRGLRLLFLTPNQDILANIRPILDTYTLIFAGIAMVTLLVIYALAAHFSRPLIRLSEYIGAIKDTRSFDKNKLHVSNEKELVILESSFCRLIDNVNSLIDDIRLQGEKEKRSQLQALQAQINPHFIFNAMDVVNWLALSRDCDDIANIMDSIAKLMRYSISNADTMVPITMELINIKEFITIYQIRHSNHLQLIEKNISENIYIPKFTLQPLVENSIRHAQCLKGDSLLIEISAWREDDKALIEVHDNGVGCDAEELNRHLRYEATNFQVSGGFGLRNVNERISLWFRSDSGLTYRNEPDHSLTACITLDLSQQKDSIEYQL